MHSPCSRACGFIRWALNFGGLQPSIRCNFNLTTETRIIITGTKICLFVSDSEMVKVFPVVEPNTKGNPHEKSLSCGRASDPPAPSVACVG